MRAADGGDGGRLGGGAAAGAALLLFTTFGEFPEFGQPAGEAVACISCADENSSISKSLRSSSAAAAPAAEDEPALGWADAAVPGFGNG